MPSIAQLVQNNVTYQGTVGAHPADMQQPSDASPSVPIVGTLMASRGAPPVGSVLDMSLGRIAGFSGYQNVPIRSRAFVPSTPQWLIKNKVSGSVSQAASQSTQKLSGNIYYNSKGAQVKFFTVA